jgi:hypothetical protein
MLFYVLMFNVDLYCVNYFLKSREKLKKKLEISGSSMVAVEAFGDSNYSYDHELLGDPGSLERQYVSKSSGSGSLRGSGRRERGGKASRPPKMRQKKYNQQDVEEGGEDPDGSNSLMKRRRKMELQVQVDPSSQPVVAPLHSLAFNDMGPPDDTPRKQVFKFKGSKDIALNGPLESPLSLDKHVSFDGSFNIAADTPTLSKLMNLIPPHGSKPGSTLTSDSLRFDFDEIVQHFPSPRTGFPSPRLGYSPRAGDLASTTWSGLNLDSTTSVGSIGASFFNFPESTTGPGPSGFSARGDGGNKKSSTDDFNLMLMSPKSPNKLTPLSSTGSSTPGSVGLIPSGNFTPGVALSSGGFGVNTPGSGGMEMFEDQGKFGSMKKRGRRDISTDEDGFGGDAVDIGLNDH